MTESWSPVQFERTDGNAPIVLVCEHASHVAPSDFDELGLSDVARKSHAAWDIGALDVARQLSLKLDAPPCFMWCYADSI
jgi:predicted N-formylglutamate amidohydrolase